MSYDKASRSVIGGFVMKQTVMWKIQDAVPTMKPMIRQKVSVFYVYADEDYVKLQTGVSWIVLLVSV